MRIVVLIMAANRIAGGSSYRQFRLRRRPASARSAERFRTRLQAAVPKAKDYPSKPGH